jgi:hypothetical protein
MLRVIAVRLRREAAYASALVGLQNNMEYPQRLILLGIEQIMPLPRKI